MPENWTVGTIIDWTTKYFEDTDIPDARVDAEILLSHVLNCRRLQLYLKRDEPVGKNELKKYKGLILERKKRRPLSYILGEQEFMGLKFKVNDFTLIPRPETELLVEEVKKIVDSERLETVMELGTGSGNIAAALSRFSGAKRIYSSDLSLEALRVAQANVNSNGAASKVILKHGDLFDAFKGESLEGKIDLIVSNPPYVALMEKETLLPELQFEPQSALFGGDDGLDFYKRIAKDAPSFLMKGGYLALEMNSGKSSEIQNIIGKAGFNITGIIRDYSGLERILIAKTRE